MDRVPYGYHEITMPEAVERVRRAGYRPTEHGTFQRGLWRAVKLTPVGTGVVVRRAWTTAQIIALGVFVTLVGLFVLGG